jgi:hypothetical protein
MIKHSYISQLINLNHSNQLSSYYFIVDSIPIMLCLIVYLLVLTVSIAIYAGSLPFDVGSGSNPGESIPPASAVPSVSLVSY